MTRQIPFEKGLLNYSAKGEGSAVVLLHGFPEDLTIWDDFSEKLSKKHRVIAIDLPGFGGSSVFEQEHSMDFMANAVYFVLHEEGIEKSIMVGHSMGGYVTLAFAERYPDKLNGIVLFHSQAAADTDEGKINRNRTIELIKTDRLGFIYSFLPLMFAEENVAKLEDEISKLKKMASSASKEAVIAALAGMRDRPDRIKTLTELEIPVYFIMGKKDSRIPINNVLNQLEYPQNCEALILDNVGHMGFIEAPEMTLMALEHFIERYN